MRVSFDKKKKGGKNENINICHVDFVHSIWIQNSTIKRYIQIVLQKDTYREKWKFFVAKGN